MSKIITYILDEVESKAVRKFEKKHSKKCVGSNCSVILKEIVVYMTKGNALRS